MTDFGVSNLFRVDGLVFVVTGGGSGLGEWMALALDANGASKVFILGRRKESLEQVAAKATNGTLIPITCDVSSKESLKAAADLVKKETPFVNVVIANGGILGPMANPPRAPDAGIAAIQDELWDLPLEHLQQMNDINVHGAFYTFVAFMQLLEAGNTHPESRGKIESLHSQFITVTSHAAFSRLEKVSHFYASGKAALLHLTKTLATGFAKRGIRVNSIAPGLYITEMTDFFANGQDWSQPGSLPVDTFPLTRTGKPEDIAGAILFLTSKAGAYVNGNILLSDGGQMVLEPSTY